MKIRRVLATAVVAAVTTPAVLLSVTPALADADPSASVRTQQQAEPGKPSLGELKKAVRKAQKEYDNAVAAEKAARTVLDAALSDDAPLTVAARSATQEAADAATAKENADKALAHAQAALAALPETATAEEKAAAEKAVADAGTAARSAADAEEAAGAKATEAWHAADDARVAAARAYSTVQNAVKDALQVKEAAEKALADALDDSEPGAPACVPETKLSTVVTGLPSKIVAGSTTDFSLRVTNGTDRTLDEVSPHVYFHATDKSGFHVIDDAFHLQWATTASPAWKNVGELGDLGPLKALKAGAGADVKLRLKVDAKAPAGGGLALVGGDYVNNDESCGGNFTAEQTFELLAATAGDSKPGKPTPQPSHTEQQGGTSTPSHNEPHTDTSTTSLSTDNPTGTLASTGSPSALPQIAMTAGAAVALGAVVVLVGRRRKADAAS